jgi:hypothetical protein
MKSFLRSLSGALAAACILAGTLASSPAMAVVALSNASSRVSTMDSKIIAYGDVSAYSNATTSYTDVTGSNFTYTPTVNDCTTAGRVLNIGATRACYLKVTWSFDVTKATATTGSCAVFANGAVIAASARFAASTLRQTIGGVLVVPVTVVGTQTIKMQCISADTNALTVNNGHVVVEEFIPA